MITRPSKPSARNVAAAVALASPPPNSMKIAFRKRVSSLSTPSGRRRRTDRAGSVGGLKQKRRAQSDVMVDAIDVLVVELVLSPAVALEFGMRREVCGNARRRP